MQIFSGGGFEFLLRWAHVLAGIVWIGLLYHFNFVQGPFFAETDPPTKSAATRQLLPRGLAWFRWGAMLTVLSGAFILVNRFRGAPEGVSIPNTPWGTAILTGALLGIVMFFNVWLVIWPKQRIVIANAVAVANGSPAIPGAAAAARRSFLVSRTNVVFSVPMLFFMSAASHFPIRTNNLGTYWGIVLLLAALVEVNALAGQTGATKQPLETVPGVIVTGFVLWAALYAAVETVLT